MTEQKDEHVRAAEERKEQAQSKCTMLQETVNRLQAELSRMSSQVGVFGSYKASRAGWSLLFWPSFGGTSFEQIFHRDSTLLI